MRVRHVAIVGGGVSGLAAAFALREIAAERGLRLNVTVIERARAGGCVETLHRDGFIMETGADSLVTEKPWGLDLVRRLGLEDDLTAMRGEYKGARVARGRRLIGIPDDFRLFTPTSFGSMASSGLFGPLGVTRIAMEPFVSRRRSQDDESVAAFVERRFGRDLLDRLAQPLVGAIFSGDPRRLSMQATLPRLAELERRQGSIVRGLRALRNGAPASAPRLLSLGGGLGELAGALASAIGPESLLSGEVVALQRDERQQDKPWRLQLKDGPVLEADAVICAAPAHAAARLLEAQSPSLSELLGSIPYHSVATINFAFDARACGKLPRSTGFLVPSIEGRHITAATIANQKYPGRAPDGSVLIRASMGGANAPAALARTDEELIRVALADVRDLLRLSGEPRFAIVRRWPDALPEYAVGHVDLVTRIEREAARLPDFALAGSAYHGAGIPDCVHSGESAAEAIAAALV